MNAIRRAAVVPLLSVFAACGGEAKSPENSELPSTEVPGATAAAPAPPSASAPKREGMSVQGELGEIDKAATTRLFESLGPRLADCVAKSHGRVAQVAGDAAFFLRIGEDGRVRYAYLEDSTLGDRDAEKCMLSVLEGAAWPKPRGGEAEVRRDLRFDADPGVRPPVEWGADKMTVALAKQAAALEACKAGVASKVKVTAYVEPSGKEGRVHAAGASAADKDAATKLDCVVETVKALKVPSPGSYVAKVTFSL
jgi:hypothetical protein